MSRKVTEMEEQIFEQLGTFVEDEHKDYIIECERHISIEKSYRESCCDLLARGKISKIFEHTEYAVAFVRYDDHNYLCIDNRLAAEMERLGYMFVEAQEVIVGCQLLCIVESVLKIKVASNVIIDNCLAVAPDTGKAVVFDAVDIISMYHELSVYEIGQVNELEIDFDQESDVLRTYLYLLAVDINISKKNPWLVRLLKNSLSRTICRNIYDYINIANNAMKYLTLYQCIEYLFIPNYAVALRDKYSIQLETAIRLDLENRFRKDERSSILSVLKDWADSTIIDSFVTDYIKLVPDNNNVEKVSKYIYDLRCKIAHYRYGQDKSDINEEWEDLFARMTEIIFSLYDNCSDDETVKKLITQS